MSSPNENVWATLTDEALVDEIESNRRGERRLLVVVGLVAVAATVVALIVHGLVS